MNNNKILLLIVLLFFTTNSFSQKKNSMVLDSLSKEQYYYAKVKKAVNIDSILIFSTKLLQYATTNNSKAYAYFNLAYVDYRKNNYELSITHLDSCLPLFLKEKDSNFISKTYSLKGTIASQKQLFTEAINNHKKALNYAITDADKYEVKYNISTIYVNTKQYDIAIDYINDIINYNNKNPNMVNPMLVCYSYLALTYISPTNNVKLEAAKKAVQLAYKINNPVLTAEALIILGEIYQNKQQYNNALEGYNKAIKIANKLQSTDLIIRVYLNKAQLYSKLKKHKVSNTYLDSLNTYSLNYKTNISNQTRLDTLYYHNYKNLKDYKNALKYLEHYNKYLENNKDSLVADGYAEYGKKYQTEKKIQENKILSQQNNIKDLKILQQKTLRNFLIVISLLSIIILAIIYFQYRLKKKTALQLEQQKLVLEKSNTNKQRLFSIIAHDLVNPFNAILGYTQLLENDYDNFNDTERKKFIATINKYSKNNYTLTRTLLDWAKLQQDSLIAKKTKLNCKDIITEAIKLYQVLADKKEITVTTNITENCQVLADKNMMQTVIGNLFVNAIKFTPKKGRIVINSNKNNDGTVNIEIKDNGIGMTQEQLNNLFDITKVNVRQGTNKEKGNGLGLILCNELMELQKGTLEMFSQLNEGSRAVVTI